MQAMQEQLLALALPKKSKFLEAPYDRIQLAHNLTRILPTL